MLFNNLTKASIVLFKLFKKLTIENIIEKKKMGAVYEQQVGNDRQNSTPKKH